MAYGTKYRYEWSSSSGDMRVDLQLEGYSGGITTLSPGGQPLAIEWGQQQKEDLTIPILESTAFLGFVGDSDGEQVSEVFDTAPFAWRVQCIQHPSGSADVVWQGFITANEWSDNPKTPAEEVELEATDGLRLLTERLVSRSLSESGQSGIWTRIREPLQGLHDRPLTVGMEWYPYREGSQIAGSTQPLTELSAPDTYLADELTDLGKLPIDVQKISQRAVVEDLLERFRLRLMLSGGHWRMRQRTQIDPSTGEVKMWDWDDANSVFQSPTTRDLTQSLPTRRPREKPRDRISRLSKVQSTYTYNRLGNLVGNPGFETGDTSQWIKEEPVFSFPSGDTAESEVKVVDHGNSTPEDSTQTDQKALEIYVEPTSKDSEDATIDDRPAIVQKGVELFDAGPRGGIKIGFDYGRRNSSPNTAFFELEVGGKYLRSGEFTIREDTDKSTTEEGVLPIDNTANAVSTTSPVDGVVLVPEGTMLQVFGSADTTVTISAPVRVGDTKIRGQIDDGVSSGDTVVFWYWEDSQEVVQETGGNAIQGFTTLAKSDLPRIESQAIRVSQRTPDNDPITGNFTLRAGMIINNVSEFEMELLYDDFSLEILQAGEVIERTEFVGDADNAGEDFSIQHRTGDGPGPDHERGLILAGKKAPTEDWQVGPYASGDSPSGQNLEQLTTLETLAEGRQTLDRRTRRVELRNGENVWPHHTFDIGGTEYDVRYMRRVWQTGGDNAVVELSQLKDAGRSGVTQAFSVESPSSGRLGAASPVPVGGGGGTDSTNFVSVQAKGAVGDGVADDTKAIIDAIETARRTGEKVYFPAGDYYVTDELPMYSGQIWFGDGRVHVDRVELSVLEAEDLAGDKWKLYLEESDAITHRLMDGDPVNTSGFSNDANNSATVFSLREVYPQENAVVLYQPSGTDVSDPSSEATATLNVARGGSIIRHKNLGDGSLSTHGYFINESGLQSIGLHDLSFIGPGVNSPYGGGIRFLRADPTKDEALTGYTVDNLHVEHCTVDGLRFGGVIASSFSNIRIKRCLGDGLLLEAEPGIAGASTSCNFQSIFVNSCRRGISASTIVYCAFDNCVIEGCHVGFDMRRAIGCTFNACASETIKHGDLGQGVGTTFRFVDSYSNVLNSPTVYYNTGRDRWSKCAVEIISPKDRTESQVLEIRGGHLHSSIQERVEVVGTRWNTTEDEAIYYVDPRTYDTYVPPEDGSESEWFDVDYTYLREGEKVIGYGVGRDRKFNDRPYVTKEVVKWPFSVADAVEKPRPPGPNDDSGSGFVAWDTPNACWIDTSVPPREGRYFCIRDTAGDARWIDAEALWLIRSDGRQYETSYNDPVEASESDPPYLLFVGRNWGADVVTDQTFRCIETGTTDPGGALLAWIDPAEIHPTQYLVRVNHDPFTGYSRRGYVIQDNRELVTIDQATYWKIKLIVPPSIVPDGFSWSNQWEPMPQLTSQFDELGVEFELNVPYLYEDESTYSLLLAIPAEEIVRVRDEIELFNAREPNMDGTWTVDEVEWDNAQAGTLGGNHPAVRVKAGYQDLDISIARAEDDALVAIDRYRNPVVSNAVQSSLDLVNTYDPNDAIAMEGGRDLEVVFPDGTASVTVDLMAANQYAFECWIEGSFTQVRKVSNSLSEVTFERDNAVGREVATVKARRKKSPGYRMYAGRPNDGEGEALTDGPVGDLSILLPFDEETVYEKQVSGEEVVERVRDRAGPTNYLSQPENDYMPVVDAAERHGGLRFDGTDDRLLDDPNLFAESNFTAATWLYRASGAALDAALVKGDPSTSSLNFLVGGAPGSDQVVFRVHDDTGTLHEITSSAGSLPVQTWTFVAVRYNGADMDIFIGPSVDTSVADIFTPAQDETTRLILGGTPSGGEFNGIIDHTRVYATDLSNSLVEEIYHVTR